MASSTSYDALIIGSGQAATPLALAFASAGKKAAIIEKSHIGGCCVNEGCTPTKTMIASGRAAYLTRRGQDYGIHTQEGEGQNKVVVDMVKIRQRKRDIVTQFRGGSERRLKAAGVDVLMGEGSFVDASSVNVKLNDGSEKLVKAEKIFLNVGERPASPKLEGVEKLDSNIVLDSTSIMELDVLPSHLVVIGGGYVGVEFAHLMRRLGAEVTIVQRGVQILPREDKEVAENLQDILREDGMKLLLESTTVSVAPSATNAKGFDLKVRTQEKESSISGTHLLFAAGRIPNTNTLNHAAAGLNTNGRGYIEANEFLETTVPNIFVMGDVKGPPAFTHISYDDFRIIKNNLLSTSPPVTKLSTKVRQVPYVVYTDPQLGHIGLHEHEARSQFPNKKIMTAKMPMSYVARALETDETRGMMKAVVNGDTGEILGFTCLGIEGGEIMSVVQMAMMGGLGWERLRDAVWAHPTLAESLNNLWGFLE
jgi:pyruvate/2-oxoglutarate dehydrogenase complex dihydrolipoamide dehydrogenase (E3) component